MKQLDSNDQLTEVSAANWLADWMNNTLSSWGVSESLIAITKLVILLAITMALVALLLWVTKTLIRIIISRIYKLSRIQFLKYAIGNKLPYYLGLLAPYTFVRNVIPTVFADYPGWISPMTKAADIYLILLVIWGIVALVKSFFNVLSERPSFANKPMNSYIQVISIFLYLLGVITIFSIITNQPPGVILGALGAASAVTLLIFQDSIKGFVGSIQITANHMVELGDWITMNKYGADGTVEEVSINTVKVRNFDMTITTIPTYALISDSFQNWKGMQESGGRRVKKCIYIKQGTIRFLKEDELGMFKKKDCLKEFIEQKEKGFEGFDRSLINGALPITNNDLFMAYAMYYLRNHKMVAKDMTLLVRQLPPTTEGLPVEVYIFTATTAWVEYEDIATEIINHLLAMVPVFELKVFELLSDGPDAAS